jgi:membrane protease YdiL (CAAX protease family)
LQQVSARIAGVALYHDLPLAVPTKPFTPRGASDAFTFIDLARLGRTNWWSGVKGLLKIIGWYLLIEIVLGIWMWNGAVSVRVIETAALAGMAAAAWIAVHGATVKSQRRPLLSLVSSELRLRLARVMLGAALWLVSYACLTGLFLLYDAIVDPVGLSHQLSHLALPKSEELVVTALVCVALFPFQAAGEELIFRGWLTQTLGQFLRHRWLLVAIVGLLFALAHGFSHGLFAIAYFLVISLGLSALTLTDRRLELAIGAHAANNICVVLGRLFSSQAHPQLLFLNTQVSWWALIVTVLQFALVCLAACWIVRRDEFHRLIAIVRSR